MAEKEVSPKRKPWYQAKIEELEAQVAELNAKLLVAGNEPAGDIEQSRVESYAEGYTDCMHKYGVLSKLQRRRTKENILMHGIGAVKGGKRTRFSISVPSI